jgi:hypothetical protein
VSGFWPTRLGLVHDVLARHVSAGSVPGAVALLARGGSADVFAVGDVSRDTIFRIASMTKMTQRAWESPVPGPVFRDFWTTAAAAISD